MDEKGNKSASDYSIKAMEILRLLRSEPSNSDGSIRTLLIDGLDYLEEALRIDAECGSDISRSLYVMNLAFILRHASVAEFKYAVDRLMVWYKLDYDNCNNSLALILKCELKKNIGERRLDLSDRELVEIIMDCKANIGASSLSDMLYIPAVRDVYIKNAAAGITRYAFALGTYYYEEKEYSKAFDVMKNLKEDIACKYLGLMYFYGNGVEQDDVLAEKYLESYYSYCEFAETEVIWALGQIYARYESLRKQFDFYLKNGLDSSYRDDNDPFIKKMVKECVMTQCFCTIYDELNLLVKIHRSNLRCEFSLNLPAYSFASVNWGDRKSGKRLRSGGCSMLSESKKVTFRHNYRHPGTYRIHIETPCSKSMEGFEFMRYPNQLLSVDFERCNGLKKVAIVDQQLKSLVLWDNEYFDKDYLTTLICRNNNLKSLDLRHCPVLTHLDCSDNPLTELKLPRTAPLSKICMDGTALDVSQVDNILHMNRGSYSPPMNYNDLNESYMRLEYYFRLTNWDKVRKYIRLNERNYYDHQLAECELAFAKLKGLSKEINHNPYEDKGGFLAVNGSYVSDDSILHHEEFFIEEEAWTTCLATKVRDSRRREPWMGLKPTPPEYFVASCLVNMIKNWRELKI